MRSDIPCSQFLSVYFELVVFVAYTDLDYGVFDIDVLQTQTVDFAEMIYLDTFV